MTEIKFKPINGMLLLELPKVEEKTSSGLIKSPEMIKEEEKKMDTFLTVIAMADDVNRKAELLPDTIKVGSKLKIDLQQASPIEIDDVTYVNVFYRAILGYRL